MDGFGIGLKQIVVFTIRIFFFSIGIDEISIILWLYKMFL